jgi:hypothetical protein
MGILENLKGKTVSVAYVKYKGEPTIIERVKLVDFDEDFVMFSFGAKRIYISKEKIIEITIIEEI